MIAVRESCMSSDLLQCVDKIKLKNPDEQRNIGCKAAWSFLFPEH